jgi:ATP-dependent Clp protease adapter protein ClpS/tetratricopeptide (TPR) repeat protein
MPDLRVPDTVARLPARPDLAQERRRAKDLLKAVRSGDSAAIARFRSQHPRHAALTPGRLAADVQLSDAQLVIAREYGFASWPSLKAHIEQVSGRPPGMAPYIVLIWNDETMSADFVILLLKKAFGKGEEDAQRIMLDVHHEGFGVCAVCDRLEEAEAKIVEAQAFVRERGFVVDLKLTCAHGEVATTSRSPRLVEKELGAARARQVRFDNAAMYVELVDGRTLHVPLDWFPELLGASADQRRQCMLSDQGRELSWDFGLVVSVSGLLAGRAGQAAVRPPPLPSVAACRQAVAASSRQAAPLAWAAARTALGNALFARGGAELDGALIEEAVAAHRVALEECTRERAPLDWARIQQALGVALHMLGNLRRDPARIEEAIVAFRAALGETSRLPLHERGNAWISIGLCHLHACDLPCTSQADTVHLNEAIAAFGKSEEITRERLPFNFAISSGWQGVALAMLAERRSDPMAAERAVARLSIAVEVLREADHRQHAALFADQLAKGRTLLDQLRSR